MQFGVLTLPSYVLFFALSIVEDWLRLRWLSLPSAEKVAFRNFLFEYAVARYKVSEDCREN
jgi:hypothetical protein